jgi:hypothetical protein
MNQRICLDTFDLGDVRETDERNVRRVYVALAFKPTYMTLVVLATS